MVRLEGAFLIGYPLPDPTPAMPPFEYWMARVLMGAALGFVMWWIFAMLPDEVQAYYNWKKERKERKT